jgi:2-polyprenyl-3-methyl-5-hydroxy-6-metoxy-1,4-benzoquinol methylase
MSLQVITAAARHQRWAYHGTDRFLNVFLPYMQKYLHVLEDCRVVDIGCNAGVVSAAICEYATSCIGVEEAMDAYEQALITKSMTRGDFTPIHMDAKSFAANVDNYDFNAFFAANVLYHFDQETMAMVESKILPKCNTVLIFSKENKPKKKNNFGLHTWKNIVPFLQKNGFVTECLYDTSQIFTDYQTGYQKGVAMINRSVEKSHTESVLVPVLGKRR